MLIATMDITVISSVVRTLMKKLTSWVTWY